MTPALLIANRFPVFPELIENKDGVSPEVATVITVTPSAADSARVAVWESVTVTAPSVTDIATVSVVAELVPSDTEIVRV